LPRDLSETYFRILERIDRMDIEDNRVIVQRVLRWTTWAKSGISLQEVQEAVAVNPGDNNLAKDTVPKASDILDLCSSLVRWNPAEEKLELAHATVKEFLSTIPSSSEFYFYRVDENSDKVDLAVTSLTYLCFDDWGLQETREAAEEGRIHFLRHASWYWDDYAENNLHDPDLMQLQKSLFASKKTPQFINWASWRMGPA